MKKRVAYIVETDAASPVGLKVAIYWAGLLQTAWCLFQMVQAVRTDNGWSFVCYYALAAWNVKTVLQYRKIYLRSLIVVLLRRYYRVGMWA